MLVFVIGFRVKMTWARNKSLEKVKRLVILKAIDKGNVNNIAFCSQGK